MFVLFSQQYQTTNRMKKFPSIGIFRNQNSRSWAVEYSLIYGNKDTFWRPVVNLEALFLCIQVCFQMCGKSLLHFPWSPYFVQFYVIRQYFFRIYSAFVETILDFQSPIFPGDPARFHSFYIAVIVLGDTQLDNQEIAAMSRLGTSVKKTVLICSEDEHHKLTYISLQWAGITWTRLLVR